MQINLNEVAARAVAGLVKLAYKISGVFPHHGFALRNELYGDVVTNERWRRAAAIIASLRALPGTDMTESEHEVRNLATAHMEVPNQMAQATFYIGDGRNELALERADRWSKDLEKEMEI